MFYTFFLCVALLLGLASMKAQDVFEAARQGDVKRLSALYALKPDTLSSVNAAGFPPLVIAGYHHQNEAVVYLLNHGASVNQDSPEGPVLLAAAYKGYADAVQLILTYRPDVNACNALGTTALIYASMLGRADIVSMLLRAGADKGKKEVSGRDAAFYANQREYKEVLRLLE